MRIFLLNCNACCGCMDRVFSGCLWRFRRIFACICRVQSNVSAVDLPDDAQQKQGAGNMAYHAQYRHFVCPYLDIDGVKQIMRVVRNVSLLLGGYGKRACHACHYPANQPCCPPKRQQCSRWLGLHTFQAALIKLLHSNIRRKKIHQRNEKAAQCPCRRIR